MRAYALEHYDSVKLVATPRRFATAACALALLPFAQLAAQCDADAGELTADPVRTNPESGNVVLSAFRLDSTAVPSIPNGFLERFVLASRGVDGGDTVIAVAPDAYFEVVAAGTYGIHTVIAQTSDAEADDFVSSEVLYPAGRRLADLAATFDTLCGAFDLAGVGLTVSGDLGQDCRLGEDISAGSLSPEFTQIVAGGDSVAIRVTRDTPVIVPPNYEVLYLLASGAELVVVDTSREPRFVLPVADTGVYTTTTFVAELTDASATNYFDPARIALGTTTVGEINSIYAGEDICADVDVIGAQSFVQDLSGGTCPAEAGTLDSAAVTVDSSAGTAVLRANRSPQKVAFLGEDQEIRYVLTRAGGDDLVVVDLGEEPSFTIDTAGTYRIHTLVAEVTDTSSADYLDLSVVEPGVTTAAEVLGLIRDNSLCAVLDATGARFTVAADLLVSGLAPAIPSAASGIVAYQAARGLLRLEFTPSEQLGGSATIALSDAVGRPVAVRTLAGVRTGERAQLDLDLPAQPAGYYVVTIAGERALSAQAIVLR